MQRLAAQIAGVEVPTVATLHGAGERGEIDCLRRTRCTRPKTCSRHTVPASGRAHASCCSKSIVGGGRWHARPREELSAFLQRERAADRAPAGAASCASTRWRRPTSTRSSCRSPTRLAQHASRVPAMPARVLGERLAGAARDASARKRGCATSSASCLLATGGHRAWGKRERRAADRRVAASVRAHRARRSCACRATTRARASWPRHRRGCRACSARSPSSTRL